MDRNRSQVTSQLRRLFNYHLNKKLEPMTKQKLDFEQAMDKMPELYLDMPHFPSTSQFVSEETQTGDNQHNPYNEIYEIMSQLQLRNTDMQPNCSTVKTLDLIVSEVEILQTDEKSSASSVKDLENIQQGSSMLYFLIMYNSVLQFYNVSLVVKIFLYFVEYLSILQVTHVCTLFMITNWSIRCRLHFVGPEDKNSQYVKIQTIA